MYSFDFEKMNNVSRTDMCTCETVTWLYVGVRKPFTFEVGIYFVPRMQRHLPRGHQFSGVICYLINGLYK